jgi:hypothetical protein
MRCGTALRTRTASLERSQPLWKCLSVGGLHVSDGVVERVADEAREGTVASPIDGVSKPLEQRERQRDRDPLFLGP